MKKVMAIALITLVLAGLVGCYAEKGEAFTSGGRFVVVEHNTAGSETSNYILKDSETGVMYLLLYSSSSYGPHMALTVLLNPDGTPMIYGGEG
jgi:hypothetical protein